jgi:hypothetical protein
MFYEMKVVCSTDRGHDMFADLCKEKLLEKLLKNGKEYSLLPLGIPVLSLPLVSVMFAVTPLHGCFIVRYVK